MVNNIEYNKGVMKNIAPKFSNYIHTLVGLCDIDAPTAESIELYFDEEGDLTATRDVFNTVEGCGQAMDMAINAKLEYYNPCANLLRDINRKMYNGYKWSDGAVDTDMFRVITGQGTFGKMLKSSLISEIYDGMVDLMRNIIFTNFNDATVIIFTEAILLYSHDCYWDFTGIEISVFKKMIADVRTGNSSSLLEHIQSNLFDIVSGEKR